MNSDVRFLGVDGGGSGCRVVLADVSGRVLSQAASGPANIATDPEVALANILAATTTALAQVVGQDRAAECLPHLVAGMGLAGANAAGAADWLGQHLPFSQSRIVTDAVTSAMGALAGADGIVAAIGTGSVFAVQRGSQMRQIGGWGLALGDEGSGAVLGRALLARSLRALDGTAPMTTLLRGILEEFGSAEAVVAFSLRAKGADYATYAPRLVASDDPAAQTIMAQAVEQVRGSIAVLQGDGPLAVTFIGGLGPTYAARITDWPQRPAAGSALDGALRLAMGGARA